jgi:hypothetical protein
VRDKKRKKSRSKDKEKRPDRDKSKAFKKTHMQVEEDKCKEKKKKVRRRWNSRPLESSRECTLVNEYPHLSRDHSANSSLLVIWRLLEELQLRVLRTTDRRPSEAVEGRIKASWTVTLRTLLGTVR